MLYILFCGHINKHGRTDKQHCHQLLWQPLQPVQSRILDILIYFRIRHSCAFEAGNIVCWLVNPPIAKLDLFKSPDCRWICKTYAEYCYRNLATVRRLVQSPTLQLTIFCGVHSDLRGKGIRVSPAWFNASNISSAFFRARLPVVTAGFAIHSECILMCLSSSTRALANLTVPDEQGFYSPLFSSNFPHFCHFSELPTWEGSGYDKLSVYTAKLLFHQSPSRHSDWTAW